MLPPVERRSRPRDSPWPSSGVSWICLIAIAHARLQTLARPVLTFGRSVAGLDWDAPDGLPVHHVFLLITPVRDHGLQLQILAALAHGMAEAEPRERLVHATGADEIWAALEEALREQNLARVRAA